MSKSRTMLVVTGDDRSGIIADVTELLFRQGCNLEDITMTLLEGQFTMMLVLAQNHIAQLEKAFHGFLAAKRNQGLTIFWKDIRGSLKRGDQHLKNARPFMVTVIGRDCTGIVYRVSKILAQNKINITDLQSKIIGRNKKTLYTMLIEADVPKKVSVEKLHLSLTRLAQDMRVEIHLKPVELLSL